MNMFFKKHGHSGDGMSCSDKIFMQIMVTLLKLKVSKINPKVQLKGIAGAPALYFKKKIVARRIDFIQKKGLI